MHYNSILNTDEKKERNESISQVFPLFICHSSRYEEYTIIEIESSKMMKLLVSAILIVAVLRSNKLSTLV